MDEDCNICANATYDFNNEVDTGCYACCKGIENNYVPIKQEQLRKEKKHEKDI